MSLTTDQKIEISKIAIEYIGKLQAAKATIQLRAIAKSAGGNDLNSLFRYIFEEVEAFALSDKDATEPTDR